MIRKEEREELMKTKIVLFILAAVVGLGPAASADCAIEPKSRQKPVPVVVIVRDGGITLNPPADQAVHLKQKSQYVRWMSTQGPFEIEFDDEAVETPVCAQAANNQWICESAAFCHRDEGTNTYKYSVIAGDIVLDPQVIVDP